MPRDNALVDGVKEISRALPAQALSRERSGAQYATVAFGGGRQGLLDLAEHRSRVWAEVLESLRETGTPAYVEIDPHTHLITEVLQPLRFRVGRMEKSAEGYEVELVISHARHLLRRSNPDYEQIRRTLEQARKDGSEVLVTETVTSPEILDARPASGEPTPAPRPARRR